MTPRAQPGQRRTTNENRYVRSVSARPVAESGRRTDERSDQPSAARRAGDRPRQAERRCQKTVTTTEKTLLRGCSTRRLPHLRSDLGKCAATECCRAQVRTAHPRAHPNQRSRWRAPERAGADRVSAPQRANAARTCRYKILGHQRRRPLRLLGGSALAAAILQPVRKQLSWRGEGSTNSPQWAQRIFIS